MPNRFPRTVAELAAHNRCVVVRCEDCQHHRDVPPDVLDMTFGPEFDVYAGYRELVAQLRCEMCGQRHRQIDIADRNERAFRGVSFDESVAHTLEMNALIRARGGETAGAIRAPRRRER